MLLYLPGLQRAEAPAPPPRVFRAGARARARGLGDAVAVPEVHEGEVVHVAGHLHPSRDGHRLAHVIEP